MFVSLRDCDCELARKVLAGCQKHAEERTQAARVAATEKQGRGKDSLASGLPFIGPCVFLVERG